MHHIIKLPIECFPLNDRLTVAELQQRWNNALILTQAAVIRQPDVYRELKCLAGDIVTKPLDITEYMPAARRLMKLFEKMDPNGKGSIFQLFNDRINPSSIWDVCWLRLECKDMLAHLEVFDKWRLKHGRLKIVK